MQLLAKKYTKKTRRGILTLVKNFLFTYRFPSWFIIGFFLVTVGLNQGFVVSQTQSQESFFALNDDLIAQVKDNSSFALDLYNRVRTQEGNLFFSPYSISTAVAMTYAGARNETATEIANVMHFSLKQERLHPTFGMMLANFQTELGSQLNIANGLWGQEGYGFLAQCIELIKNNYKAPIAEVDFTSKSEDVRQQINAWIAQETQNQITDFISEGALNSETRLVLTNAVSFQGSWEFPFDENLTKEEPFTIASGEQVSVPMMHHPELSFVSYADLPELKILELPYVGSRLSAIVLLPKQANGLAQLEAQLTPENLNQWLSALAEFPPDAKIAVWLPKLNISSELNLKRILSAMGMEQAFNEQADFSGFNGKQDLYLSHAVHKAYVNIDEMGTQAGVATGAIGATRGGLQGSFRGDRPFIFLIRDNVSKTILFLGRVVNPLE
ncbi:serpin family protein [Oscillatoria salina]|uniref:serpin family protein n=1 Tax=Oscillatoria salina TaxID=331517 RepID=UPI0013B72119|nr:serpin family protein [Oscillatoria salina]MBZ8180150.1 serpin family protein [Oscillatoria salina IIICB1]NET88612.1 serpin family protein [Kamptonema sp. SIO1D9]